MRSWVVASLLLFELALTGCGSKDTGVAAGNPAEIAPRSGNLSAEEMAEEARGEVDCPAEVATAARPAGAPADDVVGVRPGMTYDEAVNMVLCSHDLLVVEADGSRAFQIQTFGEKLRQGFNARFAQPRVEKTSNQIIEEMQDRALARSSNRLVEDMNAGEAKWYVATLGMPGQERVLSVAREEWFKTGAYPTIASVRGALVAKYGQPTDETPTQYYQQKALLLNWRRDAQQNHTQDERCSLQADPDAATNYNPDCGVGIAAALHLRQDNPELVEYMQVAAIDKAGGYAAIVATEEGLKQLDARRRAGEVQQSEKNADAPTL